MIPLRDPDAAELARLADVYRLATAWEQFKDALPVRVTPPSLPPPPLRRGPNRAERRAAARK